MGFMIQVTMKFKPGSGYHILEREGLDSILIIFNAINKTTKI